MNIRMYIYIHVFFFDDIHTNHYQSHIYIYTYISFVDFRGAYFVAVSQIIIPSSQDKEESLSDSKAQVGARCECSLQHFLRLRFLFW